MFEEKLLYNNLLRANWRNVKEQVSTIGSNSRLPSKKQFKELIRLTPKVS